MISQCNTANRGSHIVEVCETRGARDYDILPLACDRKPVDTTTLSTPVLGVFVFLNYDNLRTEEEATGRLGRINFIICGAYCRDC